MSWAFPADGQFQVMGILRLLLAISVTVMHFMPALGVRFLVEGHVAVKLFYIISGFYMALVLTERYTGPGSYRTFLGNRLLRLLPTYYLLLLLPVAVTIAGRLLTGRPLTFGGLSTWSEHGHHIEPMAGVLLAVSNLTVIGQEFSWAGAVEAATGNWVWTDDRLAPGMVPGFSFLGIPPSWTLGIELEFYCLAPMLVALRTSRLLWVCVASLLCRLALAGWVPSLNALWQSHFLPTELIYFLTGVLSYRAFAAQRDAGNLPTMAARARFVVPGLIGLFVAYPHLPVGPRTVLVAGALALALPFVFALTSGSQADRALGELSYPLYLVHWNLAYLWSSMHQKGWLPGFDDKRLATLAFVGVSLLASVALVHLVETPVNRLRERRRLASLVPSPA